METKTLPQIGNSEQITPEAFRQYIEYIADMRLNQKRWFNNRNYSALMLAKQMEANVDKFNARMLDLTPTLF